MPPERIVYTEIFEQMQGPAVLTTLTFEEKDGRTTLTSTSVWPSAEILAGAIAMGMEAGVIETYERLDEHLRTMA